MTLEEMIIESHFDSLAWFPRQARDLTAHLGYTIYELGELGGLIKKCDRDQLNFAEPMVRLDMAQELTDAFVHLLNCAAIMNVSLEEMYKLTRGKNIERWGEPDHQAALASLDGIDH